MGWGRRGLHPANAFLGMVSRARCEASGVGEWAGGTLWLDLLPAPGCGYAGKPPR